LTENGVTNRFSDFDFLRLGSSASKEQYFNVFIRICENDGFQQ
jgi:hypothetical protein